MIKHIITMTLAILLCTSCAYTDLEQRLARLEKSKAKDYMVLAAETGARKFWWRNSMTDAADSLDKITCGTSGGALSDGDMALIGSTSGTTGNFYIYHYDASGTHGTDSPGRITCDDTATGGDGGAWYLCNVYVQSIVSNAADGAHYIDASNSDHLDSGSKAQGRCYYNKTENAIECASGTTEILYWTATGAR